MKNNILINFTIFFGLLFRVTLIKFKSINPDDINFYDITLNSSFSDLVQVKYWAIDYPQLFFLLFKVLSLSISQDLIVLKFINLAFYIGSAIMLYRISKQIFPNSKTLSLQIIGVHAFSPLFITADTTFNPYSGVMFLSLLLIERFMIVRVHYCPRNKLLLVATILMGSFFSYAFYFVLASIVVYVLIEFVFKKDHLARKKLLYVGGFILLSTVPSLIQLLVHVSNFSPMAPHPTTFESVFNRYLGDIWPVRNIYFNIFLAAIVCVVVSRDMFTKRAHIPLIVTVILCVCFFSYYAMDLLDLFLTTRLFFLFHIGLVLMLFALLHRSKMGVVMLVVTYVIMSAPTLRTFIFHKTNKQIYEKIAESMYVTCTPDSFYAIDSSSFHYYPLYHYYIPNAKAKTQDKYECILGQTRTFDVDIKRDTPIDYTAKRYFFINLNNKIKRGDYWSALCQEGKECFVYNLKMNKFVRVTKTEVEQFFNLNNIRSEFE